MSTKHRKSAMGRSRDLGTGSNGKGDADRVSDTAAYAANYDAINWGPKEDRTKINPAWVNAPIGIDGTVWGNIPDNHRDLKNGPDGVPGVDGVPVVRSNSSGVPPDPALEDYEKWDR